MAGALEFGVRLGLPEGVRSVCVCVWGGVSKSRGQSLLWQGHLHSPCQCFARRGCPPAVPSLVSLPSPCVVAGTCDHVAGTEHKLCVTTGHTGIFLCPPAPLAPGADLGGQVLMLEGSLSHSLGQNCVISNILMGLRMSEN